METINGVNITTRTNLYHIPAADKHLMEIAPGLDVSFAISHADCLDGAVRTLLNKAVADGGMDVDIAFLCEFAMDASRALRSASGITA